MSSYTPADIRKKVDDFDDIIRAAVIERNIESVFGKKRRNFVSNIYDFGMVQFTKSINRMN